MNRDSFNKLEFLVFRTLIKWWIGRLRFLRIRILILPIVFLTSCSEKEAQDKFNVLLICVDDLRPELNSFGASHIFSPHVDALAENGVAFHKHYVNSPSCGPSRYTLLTGKYGPSNNYALFERAAKVKTGNLDVDPSMPEWFRKHGYTAVSVGKVSHHPGGMGGKNWNDSGEIEIPHAWDRQVMPVGEWQHPRGMMHGLAHGEIRIRAGDMDVYQSMEGDDTIYPDGLITEEAIKQLRMESKNPKKPFFLAVGLLKPHLPFGAPKSYYERYKGVTFPALAHPQKPEGKTTWHSSGEFMKYNRWNKDPNKDPEFADQVRRHYAACVSYADAQIGKIMAELKSTGQAEKTIVVLWGDHGWHLGEHSIWGKHSLFEESLLSPLIIHYPGMDNKGIKTDALVETVDIFPTLCELTGIEIPKFVQGESLVSNLENPENSGHHVLGYQNGARTIRTDRYRLTIHDNGAVELYDHFSTDMESKNIAKDNPELVENLKKKLESKSKSFKP